VAAARQSACGLGARVPAYSPAEPGADSLIVPYTYLTAGPAPTGATSPASSPNSIPPIDPDLYPPPERNGPRGPPHHRADRRPSPLWPFRSHVHPPGRVAGSTAGPYSLHPTPYPLSLGWGVVPRQPHPVAVADIPVPREAEYPPPPQTRRVCPFPLAGPSRPPVHLRDNPLCAPAASQPLVASSTSRPGHLSSVAYSAEPSRARYPRPETRYPVPSEATLLSLTPLAPAQFLPPTWYHIPTRATLGKRRCGFTIYLQSVYSMSGGSPPQPARAPL
jgi:hypothetical protein